MSFLQLHVQDERVFPITSGWHLLLRGEFGTTLVSHVLDLPGSLRFFAGGDQSVRGFAFDDLSPILVQRNANGTFTDLKVGGRDVLTGTMEVIRDLPRNLGLSVFSDFGNAFDDFGHSPNPAYPHFLEYSVGIGLRCAAGPHLRHRRGRTHLPAGRRAAFRHQFFAEAVMRAWIIATIAALLLTALALPAVVRPGTCCTPRRA